MVEYTMEKKTSTGNILKLINTENAENRFRYRYDSILQELEDYEDPESPTDYLRAEAEKYLIISKLLYVAWYDEEY